MHGRGILYFPDGSPAYDGEWDSDMFQGRGILYNQNPEKFDYSFNYRDFAGLGDYWVKYDGEFKQDMKDGVGTLTLGNGESFFGSFQRDLINGPGTFKT